MFHLAGSYAVMHELIPALAHMTHLVWAAALAEYLSPLANVVDAVMAHKRRCLNV